MFAQTSSSSSSSVVSTINVDDNKSASIIVTNGHDFLNNVLNGCLDREQRLNFYGSNFFDNLRETFYIEYDYDNDQSGVKRFIAYAALKSLWERGEKDGRIDNVLAMSILGHVAEALVVRNCNTYPFINSNYLSAALNIEVSPTDAINYKAIGTGLKTTSEKYPMYFNPNDPQADIRWVNKNNNNLVCYDYAPLVEDNQNLSITAKIAGLQIKASIDGLKKVVYYILDGKYYVPVIYFGVNNDYYKIVERLCKDKYTQDQVLQYKMSKYVYELIKPAGDVDPAGFREFLYYYEMLTDWAYHRITIDDLIRQIDINSQILNTKILKKSLMSSAVSESSESRGIILKSES